MVKYRTSYNLQRRKPCYRGGESPPHLSLGEVSDNVSKGDEMYYALDLEAKTVVDDCGCQVSVEDFKSQVEVAAENDKCLDMTLMTQRFIIMGYDFDALIKFYHDNP
jgi:hypothetical protein